MHSHHAALWSPQYDDRDSVTTIDAVRATGEVILCTLPILSCCTFMINWTDLQYYCFVLSDGQGYGHTKRFSTVIFLVIVLNLVLDFLVLN